MFTMAKIKDTFTLSGGVGKSNYLDSHLVHNDYYSENNTVKGKWIGKLAKKLGINNSSIKPGDINFELLRKNINPLTGEKLTPRNRPGGIRYFDFQCSAQKSVSIMAVTLCDDRLRKAHENAFQVAFKELEKFAACRDNSQFGKILDTRTTGNLAAAVFNHDASRSLDPQLHSHCVVVNATYDSETDQVVALESKDIVKAIRYAGKVYQNQLALNVRKLGYKINEKVNSKGTVEGFEIAGVSDEIQKRFSKRRIVIEAEIEKFKEKHGRKPTTEEIKIITKESRDSKLAEITTEEVIENQRKQLSSEEMNSLDALIKDTYAKTKNSMTAELNNNNKINSAIEYSIGHLYSRSSVLKGNQILAESLNQGIGYTDLDKLKEQIKENAELITIKDNNKNYYLGENITTVTGMQREIWAVYKVNQTKKSMTAMNPKYKPFSDKASLALEVSRKRNYKEHREALKKILKSKDQFISLRGVAGAGKTTSLTELQKALYGKINNVIFLSPTTAGVDVLKKEGFDNAVTIEKFKLTQDSVNIKNGLIVVDEAGLLSNIDGTEIMKASEKNNARILFVGDTKQHKSIAAGDFLRILETYSQIQQLELSEIYRQKKHYKEATTLMAGGNIEGGIHLLDTHKKMGWINEGRGKYKDNAIKDYLKFTDNGKQLDRCIFISPTNKECNDITLELRSYLKENSIIDKQKMFNKETFISDNWTAQQKRSVKNFVPGQKILITQDFGSFQKNEIVEVQQRVKDRFNQNRVQLKDGRFLANSQYKNYEAGETNNLEFCRGEKIMARMPYKNIVNGDVFTITGIDKHGNITTTEGIIIPKEYKSLKYGYVSTSHKKQGSKAEFVVIAAETLNKDSIYVASTRGVHECRINVPDKEKLYSQANILTERTAALDIVYKQKKLSNVKANAKNKIVPRERIWNRVKISAAKLRGKLIKYINFSKEIDSTRINRAEAPQDNKYNIADPFKEMSRQNISKSQNKTIDKGMSI